MNHQKIQQVLANPMVAQNLRRQFATSREYDLPDLAGYSFDARTLYVDKDSPKTMMYRGKAVSVERFLVLRAQVEKAVIDAYRHGDQQVCKLLGMTSDNQTAPARAVATATMETQVAMEIGTDGLRTFQAFVSGHHKVAGDDALRRIPANLDITQYQEHDQELLMYMKRRMLD